jgi:hypothetical protein
LASTQIRFTPQSSLKLAEERRMRLVGGIGTAADGSTLFLQSRGQNRNSSDRRYEDWLTLAAALPNDDSNEY